MISILRQEILTEAPTIVVKVGTRILTDEKGHLSESQIESFANQLAEAREKGFRVVLVSSGAVGSGIGRLGLPGRPTGLAQLQAVAAVGQSALIEAYNHFLEKLGLHAAQLLLTADDLEQRTQYLNIRNTINALLEFGAIPIINENDTLSVAELRTTFGDNDHLAALVADLIHAPLLILLSDIDGLYDGDPRDPNSKLIETVHQIDGSILDLAFDRLTGLSKGGMASKLRIAHQITNAGGSMIIANGREPKILQKILNCEQYGTLFLPQGVKMTARKQWIGYAIFPHGRVLVDDGCAKALAEKGGSLLAVGIREVEGNFDHGEVVAICTQNGLEIARGLTNYSSEDLQRIRGKHTSEIREEFPEMDIYEEVVHRDNLTLTKMVS